MRKIDTAFIIIHSNSYYNVINDTLHYDLNEQSYISKNQTGTYRYSDKSNGFCEVGTRSDTVLLGEKVANYFKIIKYIYPNSYFNKRNMEDNLHKIDSCDRVHPLSSSNVNNTINENYSNISLSNRVKCYHENFNFSIGEKRYLFWRTDSGSDDIIEISNITNKKRQNYKVTTDPRLYVSYKDINLKCIKPNIACINIENIGFMNNILNSFSYKTAIFINEEIIDKSSLKASHKENKKIQFNKYFFVE